MGKVEASRRFAFAVEENEVKVNVGTMDRIARAVLGVALIAATLSGLIGVWGWIGVVPLGTAMVSFCPLYALLGINSCPATQHP
jgi:Inner membrane protein YgaP-like, transmembrane domain